MTTARDIVIPKGSDVAPAPRRTDYVAKHVEILVALDKDTTASLRLPKADAERLGLISEAAK